MVQKGYIREWPMRLCHSNGLFIVPFANGRVMVTTIGPVTVTFANGTFLQNRYVHRKILGAGVEKRYDYRYDYHSGCRTVRNRTM
jgi:hypothetical protein